MALSLSLCPPLYCSVNELQPSLLLFSLSLFYSCGLFPSFPLCEAAGCNASARTTSKHPTFKARSCHSQG